LALPVLRYSFGIINCHQEELRKLDRKARKLLTIHGQHHPKADVDSLYVSRKYRGRGLMQLEETYIIEITKLMEYVGSTGDPLIQVVRTHQNNIKSAKGQRARSLRTELHKGTRQRRA
jgi:GNAT superfamily N-acetyltransferase